MTILGIELIVIEIQQYKIDVKFLFYN